MFFVLFLLLTCVNSEVSHLYQEYPQDYIPDVDNILNSHTLDVNAFGPTVYLDDIEFTDRLGILEKYKFSDEYQGFIFNENDNCTYTLMRNTTKKTFTGNFGKLMKRTGWKYYEKKTYSKKIYIDLKIGYVQEYHRENLENYCFYTSSEVDQTLCDQIPRCLGYITNNCLISYLALNEKIIYEKNEYHEKINQHYVFKLIGENLIAFGFGTFALIIVEFAVFNFNLIKPITKGTLKVIRGSLRYIGHRKKKTVKTETTYEF